jgi:hypothetical protein
MKMRVLEPGFCALLLVVSALPANGQWVRVVFSGKGMNRDIPSPHPLTYFTANPFLRDDGNEFCVSCTPERAAKAAENYSIRAEVRSVGVLSGFRLLDVLYYVSSRSSPNDDMVKWKSILVQIGPDRYREIFHLQAFYTTVSISSSRIVQSGTERVLVSEDSDGGNGGGCWEGYWWFDESGPHALDFSIIEAAIHARVPNNSTFGMTCSYLDLNSGRIRSPVQDSQARCHACGYLGAVTASFNLEGPILKLININFTPEKRPDP